MDDSARQAFALWTRAQPAVSAFVNAMVHDRADRDDVLQDVAVAVLEAFPRYDAARPFLPWAMGVARIVVADAMRRRGRRPAIVAPEAVDAMIGAISEVSEEERGRMRHLVHCVGRLDGRSRHACELRYRAGLSPARVAEAMGIQPNTASKILQRVREQLRECIESRVRSEARA